MNKMMSLIKASAFDNMTLFTISGKKQTKKIEKIFPLLFTGLCFGINWALAELIIKELLPLRLETTLLSLFIIYTSVMTIIEGIYKSSGLLFNCKDDNLLFSLPINKSTILFIRILKFYLFELLYNSMFLLPAMIVYAIHVPVGLEYYIASLAALLVLPIIPIVVSSVVGGTIAAISSRFKFKTLVEILITGGSLLAIFLIAMNFDQDVSSIVQKAVNVNERTMNLYYPIRAYIKLITDFHFMDFIIFIFTNVSILGATILILSKTYFKINSKIKIIKSNTKKGKYIIASSKPIASLAMKELKRFISSPIYVTNSAFGLALFVIGTIFIASKFNSIVQSIIMQNNILSYEQIRAYMPVILFGFICFTALMTSITSSMISLEGRAFTILKSFPVKSFTVVLGKVLAALVIMIPFILLGDMIVMLKFQFTLFEMLIILATSFVLPLVAEFIGIIVNLKYPRMDAENDTQVVKQSVSAMVAVFIGMILSVITIVALIMCVIHNVPVDFILTIGLAIYSFMAIVMLIYLKRNSKKEFYKIG